jgi:two-component system NtrC family sensor kinase
MVNNAVDAILEKSKDGDLWVRTDAQENRLRIEFTDSGPGVKDATRVFDPFYTTKPVGKGTGLGLSICYGIITEHGGNVHVQNVPPHGARFTIELPFQPSISAEAQDRSRSSLSTREGRILLVDQDESVLETAEATLRARNHEVYIARDAATAVTFLEKYYFDLIVADAGLPGQGGRNPLQDWIVAERPVLAKRCIWMRASGPLEGVSEPGPENGSRVLQKPFAAADLLALVTQVLDSVDPAPVER